MTPPKSRKKRASRGGGSLEQLAHAAASIVRQAPLADQTAREVNVCLSVARQLHPRLNPAAWRWVERQLGACLPKDDGDTLPLAAQAVLAEPALPLDPLAVFYERFLEAFQPQRRKRRGVFYTPLPLVRFIIHSVDRSLREEFGLAEGLLAEITWGAAVAQGLTASIPEGRAEDAPLVSIIDPALGAGLFLTELIHFARGRLASAEQWNERAPRLLTRLGGIEILPAAATIAAVRLAAALADTGYRFETDAGVSLRIGDALAAPLRPPWTVVLGNPPFSGISHARQPWLAELLHGRGPAGAARANYFEVAGAPLGERKHWLQDDYVKFLRVAHEQIETTGLGIVALVTNHGYLDNVTFRGLREKLAESFPRMSFVDLHGNAKRRERTPDGQRDENVFQIEQGVAIGLWRRPPGNVPSQIERADLWGTREAKLAALEQPLAFLPVCGSSPGHAYHVAEHRSHREYDAGWSIADAMPLNSTAPVTARDHFVVAHRCEELAARCRDFCDPALTDEQIRARYFTRTRSPRYLAGDTRGWKLADARRRMQATGWQPLVRRVLYRPFDWRVMLWADWLIDWPRTEVARHLQGGENVALITRRQAPPGQPWTFAWVTDCLALDGVIRSDNRGSESLFPLWLNERDQQRANFVSDFLAAFHGVNPTPGDVFHYVYALLQSTRYRQRYAAALASDFPRLLIPRSPALFMQLAEIGRRLVEAHLLRGRTRAPAYVGRVPAAVEAGYPRHSGRDLQLNASDCFEGVSAAAWAIRVGSHHVARKLFKDRRGRPLEAAELHPLGQSLGGLRRYVVLQRLLDRLLQSVDFAEAFSPDPR